VRQQERTDDLLRKPQVDILDVYGRENTGENKTQSRGDRERGETRARYSLNSAGDPESNETRRD
jgi:hypothetical protein